MQYLYIIIIPSVSVYISMTKSTILASQQHEILNYTRYSRLKSVQLSLRTEWLDINFLVYYIYHSRITASHSHLIKAWKGFVEGTCTNYIKLSNYLIKAWNTTAGWHLKDNQPTPHWTKFPTLKIILSNYSWISS